MTLEPILEVCHLSKSFGTHQVLRDVNFTVHPGDVTSILGSSGSGKSTPVSYTHLDFESPAHARAWLLRVTVNGCKSRLRAPWRRRTAPLLDAYPAAAPEEGTLLEAMQALPARDRAVLHLYYYEGYQTAEIAALTGLREGSVRSRLTRARTRLRQVLKGEDE